MKTTIRDRDVLRSLRPLDIMAYLRAAGWRPVSDILDRDRSSVWALSEADVVVPLWREAADFPLRAGELLHALEDIEQRSQEDILKDISTSSSDLLRIRALGIEEIDGSIPLDAGVLFVEHARDMVLAAACATVAPSPYWRRRKPTRAIDYMLRARMGQTERSSYVLTVHSPVPQELHASATPHSPFERRVIETLTVSLTAIREAATKAVVTGDLQPFRDAVPLGVSANLCDALIGLSRVSPKNDFEVSVAWSRRRPMGNQSRSSITVTSDIIPFIEEVSRLFKETEPQEEFELLGFVERLTRQVGAEKGQIVISTFIDERPYRVAVDLISPEYELAVEAHEYKHAISIVGQLIREGRSYQLREPHQLRVLNESGVAILERRTTIHKISTLGSFDLFAMVA